MKLDLGGTDLGNILIERIGQGKLVLMRYGPGSGGDLLLKQFLAERNEGNYSMVISTFETRNDVERTMKENGINVDLEVISLVPLIRAEMGRTARRDGFLTDGVLVTDLFDQAGAEEVSEMECSAAELFLASMSNAARKQVSSFRLVIESLPDLVAISSREEVHRRFIELKEVLREKNGTAIVGAPCGVEDHWDLTLFDAFFEVRADRDKRKLTLKNVRGSGEPPREWPVEEQDIPSASPVDN